MLNNILLIYYYNNFDIDKTKFNHIYLSMGFDAKYALLSSIYISNLLYNSNPDTFIINKFHKNYFLYHAFRFK